MNKQDDTVFLKGNRLYLRPVRREDLPLLLKWTNDPDLRGMYLRRHFPVDEIEAGEWVAQLHKRTDSVSFIICLNDGRAIGIIGVHSIDWKNRLGETETVIGEKEFWSHGYATEAKMIILHYAFDTLNLRKMHGAIYGFNKGSQAYNKKCGYQVEGVQRQHVFRNGEYHDRILVAVFREDWLPIWQKFQETGKL
jgi:RimJ/RimL family protein N-acetyltransferase